MHVARWFAGLIGGCLMLAGLILTSAVVPVTAQDITTITPTVDPTYAAIYATYAPALDGRDSHDLRIAYLIAGDVPADSVVAPEEMQAATGALAVHTWDDFIALNNTQPFQVIMIHASMLETVEAEWLATAYRDGIIIVGISLRAAQLAALVNDQCVQVNDTDLLDYVDNTWVYFRYVIRIEDEANRELLHRVNLEDCALKRSGILNGRGVFVLVHGTTRSTVYSQRDLIYLGITLTFDSIRINPAASPAGTPSKG